MFYPIGYGADPTGEEDSTAAILKAVEEAFQLKSGLELLPGITDLGGVAIDLQGGNYKISQPLIFPSGGGNVVVSNFAPFISLILSVSSRRTSSRISTAYPCHRVQTKHTNKTSSRIFCFFVLCFGKN